METELTEVNTQLYIDGEYRPAESNRRYGIYNPARPSELVGYAAAATKKDVEEAVQAAHAAFPAWSGLGYIRRAELLRQIGYALTADEDEVNYRSQLFCREHGKILRETHLEISRLGERFFQCADYADRLAADELLHCLNVINKRYYFYRKNACQANDRMNYCC